MLQLLFAARRLPHCSHGWRCARWKSQTCQGSVLTGWLVPCHKKILQPGREAREIGPVAETAMSRPSLCQVFAHKGHRPAEAHMRHFSQGQRNTDSLPARCEKRKTSTSFCRRLKSWLRARHHTMHIVKGDVRNEKSAAAQLALCLIGHVSKPVCAYFFKPSRTFCGQVAISALASRRAANLSSSSPLWMGERSTGSDVSKHMQGRAREFALSTHHIEEPCQARAESHCISGMLE